MGEITIRLLPVTVILCTHKGWSQWIQDCVHSILANDYDPFEVIVADSSPDGFIKNLLENSWPAENRLKCICIHNPEKKKSLALNSGVREAVGELLIFTDDDVLVSPQWISAYVNAFNELKNRNVRIGAMGGPVEGIWLAPKPSWWPQQWLHLTGEIDFGSALQEFSGGSLPLGANMSFPKEVFLEIGGFDESMGPAATQTNVVRGGEDSLCGLKVKKSNRAIYYVPGARVGHIMRAEKLTKVYFLRRMMLEGSIQVAIQEKLAPLAARKRTRAARYASSRLAGFLVRDLLAPALKGKFGEQMPMSLLGLAAMAYGAITVSCGSCLNRFLQRTGLTPPHRNFG
jgi:glucosyl-dolichyl phosphate glucuronosyltransferase